MTHNNQASTLKTSPDCGQEDGTTPLVSVVVITRNRVTSLARTLRALQSLTYPAYEVIVVDNGSTDDTPQIVTQFGARYMFSPLSSGISLSRQRGVDAAQGEVIAVCDDDCAPIPDWLQQVVRRLCSEKDLGLLGGQVENIGFPETQRYKGRTKMIGPNGITTYATNPKEAEFFGSANMAFRRDAIQAIGGYDPFFRAGREEHDLAMSFRRHGFRIDYEPAVIVKHYYTGINYKRGRVFYDHHLMRLYFYLKHFRPGTVVDWLRFLGDELELMGQDLTRAARGLAAATRKLKFERLPRLLIELFNVISARLAIPWLLWRLRTYHNRRTGKQAQKT